MSLPAQATDREEDEENPDPAGLIGRVLADRYEVKDLLGVGGIGRVYLAENLVLRRNVALKVLLEHYQCVPELQRRFEREAMALAALSHPNIVTITDFVSNREATFLVMELVDGRDLDEMLDEQGALMPDAAFTIMEQVLSSLAYAHEHEVIHRDLKPQNILVTELAGGRLHAVILDFGLAKFMDGSGPAANLTKTGLIVGTPAYMAPEQASGAHADKRADVYAAGIMLFEMLSGVHPFDGYEGAELLRQHLLAPPPTIASKSPDTVVSPELETFLTRALAKDTADRYADGEAMLLALKSLPENAFVPPTSRVVVGGKSRSTAPTAIAPKRRSAPPTQSPATPKKKLNLPFLVASAVAIIAMATVGYLVWRDFERSRVPALEPDPPEVSSSAEPAAIAPVEDEPVVDDSNAVEPPADLDFNAEGEGEELGDEAVADADDGDPEADPQREPVVERPPARNPWRGSTPSTLSRIRRRIQQGQTITPGHIRQLTRYRRQHPTDVRGAILLAQAFTARGVLGSGLQQYRAAYRRDPRSRGDRRMLRDLVRIASTRSHHEPATEALIEIYGQEAVAQVRRAARRQDGETGERLNATLERLQAAP